MAFSNWGYRLFSWATKRSGTYVPPVITYYFLLQEDGFNILQEDGSKIRLEA